MEQSSSQLDLAFLRDHKKYAACRIIRWERCICPAKGSGKSSFLCQCLPYYKRFVVVGHPLHLLSAEDKNGQWLKSPAFAVLTI